MTSTPPAPPVAPQTDADVRIRYEELRALHQRRYDAIGGKYSGALKGLGAGIAIFLFETYRSAKWHGHGTGWLLTGGFVAIAGVIWYSLRQQRKLTHEQRLLVLYERNLRRVDGKETQSGRTGLEAGQELRVAGHLYGRDLDLLGADSLFGLLATVRTGIGERGLARYLMEPATHEETLRRQESVKELLGQTELREKIALLGGSRFQQLSARFFEEWLADAPPAIHAAFRWALAVTAALNVALLVAGPLHWAGWGGFLPGDVLPNLALVLCVQAALALMVRRRVLALLKGSAQLQQHVRLIGDGLGLMQATGFETPKLKELQRWTLEPAGAVKLLKQLEGQLTIVEQRTKDWYYILSLLLAAGTQAAISIAAWKRANAAAMSAWLDAWGEFEALNAIAGYAFEHPEDAWPELLPAQGPAIYEAQGLRHPLLTHAVANDISLGTESRFYLISGSNMAGKSTLLRAIGVNAVLAYAGAPVRAQSLRLTPMALGASLALTDSLAEGRSKFLAEVERLSAIMRLSGEGPVLFLVDEIFSGTNSEDRRTAAGAVLERLLANGAIGALSTHDLTLTELATAANAGVNVHMASPDAEDPLAFDYLLKPGVNTASSALAILRLIGIGQL